MVLCFGVGLLFLWKHLSSNLGFTITSVIDFRQLLAEDNYLYCTYGFFNCRTEMI